jgi:hypothetical protein
MPFAANDSMQSSCLDAKKAKAIMNPVKHCCLSLFALILLWFLVNCYHRKFQVNVPCSLALHYTELKHFTVDRAWSALMPLYWTISKATETRKKERTGRAGHPSIARELKWAVPAYMYCRWENRVRPVTANISRPAPSLASSRSAAQAQGRSHFF